MHQRTTIRRCMQAVLASCFVMLALVVTSGVADACPTCKDAIALNDPQQQAMVKGYFYSILFMMSMPFIVVGTFSSMAYVSIRRARSQNADSPTDD